MDLGLRPELESPEQEEKLREFLQEKDNLIRRFERGVETGLDNLSKACMYEVIGEMNIALDLGIVERIDVEAIYEKIDNYLNDPKLKNEFTERNNDPYAYYYYTHQLPWCLSAVFSVLALIITVVSIYLH